MVFVAGEQMKKKKSLVIRHPIRLRFVGLRVWRGCCGGMDLWGCRLGQ